MHQQFIGDLHYTKKVRYLLSVFIEHERYVILKIVETQEFLEYPTNNPRFSNYCLVYMPGFYVILVQGTC